MKEENLIDPGHNPAHPGESGLNAKQHKQVVHSSSVYFGMKDPLPPFLKPFPYYAILYSQAYAAVDAGLLVTRTRRSIIKYSRHYYGPLRAHPAK
jgi:hypothetical protein